MISMMANVFQTVFGHYKHRAISTVEPVDDDDNTRGSDLNGAINQTIAVQDLPLEVLVDTEKSLKRMLNVRLLTIAVSLCVAFLLPDYPSTTRWLSPTERAVARWRLATDAGQPDESSSPESWSMGFRLTLQDRCLHVFALCFLCIQVNSSVTNYFPSVVQTLGFNEVHTLLLAVPPYLIALLASHANNRSTDHHSNSSFHIIWPLLLAISGCAVAATSISVLVRYGAML